MGLQRAGFLVDLRDEGRVDVGRAVNQVLRFDFGDALDAEESGADDLLRNGRLDLQAGRQRLGRRRELEESCAILGVRHLERLEYHDSGMMGWPGNDLADAFWQMPVETAAAPLVGLMERFRPDVVVTYDANGGYGHPDHIQAHRITMHAAAVTAIPSKIYFAAIPRSIFRSLAGAFKEAGLDDFDGEDEPDFGTPDELVTTRVDCTAVVRRKLAALAAHSSQTADSFFMKLPEPLFERVFGVEHFVRHEDRTGARVPESDLFAGLR